MAWGKLGVTTLTSVNDDITVSALANKKFIMVLMHDLPSGSTQWFPRLGAGSVDTGNNYATRESVDGGADTTVTNYSSLRWNTSVTTAYTQPKFGVGYIINISSQEKLTIFHGIAQNTAGAGTAPTREETASKWVNTSSALDTVNLNNIESGDFATDSEVVVLGTD